MSDSGFHWRRERGVPVLVPDFFDELDLSGGYSTRRTVSGRGLDLGLGGTPATKIIENRRIVCRAMGTPLEALVLAEQVHGSGVAVVSLDDRGRGALSAGDAVKGADALVSEAAGVAVGGLSADCPIVLIAAGGGSAVAAVHSGWRGTVTGVVPAALRALAGIGAPQKTLFAAIGPSIGRCCYEVGKDVLGEFEKAFEDAREFFTILSGRLFVDLAAAIRAQLAAGGVPAGRIFTAAFCTSCRRDLFFSYRRVRKVRRPLCRRNRPRRKTVAKRGRRPLRGSCFALGVGSRPSVPCRERGFIA